MPLLLKFDVEFPIWQAAIGYRWDQLLSMQTMYHLLNYFFLLGYWLLVTAMTIRILMKRRAASETITWLLSIYILPLVGIIFYFLFGEFHLGHLTAKHTRSVWPQISDWFARLSACRNLIAHHVSQESLPLFRLCERRQNIPSLRGNQFTLQTTPETVFSTLICDIQRAQHSIEMVFYRWYPGGWVNKVAEALIEATQRGVCCRLLLDSAGSSEFFRSHYPALLRSAGIKLVEALKVKPLWLFLRRMDLRQHRKIILIDHQVAYLGSMNMADPQMHPLFADIGPCIDLMVRIKGTIVPVLGTIFSWDWGVETGEHLLPPLPTIQHADLPVVPCTAVQLVASGTGFPEEMVQQTLLMAIYSARDRLIMTTPYFAPSDELLSAIVMAAQRGVQVDLVVPRYNDSIMVKWASRSFFESLLLAGVNLYQCSMGFLHTKSVCIDQRLSIVGTVNLDMRSLWLNFEVALVVDDITFASQLMAIQDNYITHSVRVNVEDWVQRPLQYRMIERAFYFFTPLL